MATQPDGGAVPKTDGPTAAEVDAVVAEFDGDLRAAIGALLADIRTLAADRERHASSGYVRRPPAPGRAA